MVQVLLVLMFRLVEVFGLTTAFSAPGICEQKLNQHLLLTSIWQSRFAAAGVDVFSADA